jgi:hypothetical protein
MIITSVEFIDLAAILHTGNPKQGVVTVEGKPTAPKLAKNDFRQFPG